MQNRESLKNIVVPVQWIVELRERVNRPVNLLLKSLWLT